MLDEVIQILRGSSAIIRDMVIEAVELMGVIERVEKGDFRATSFRVRGGI